jgi:hypothetical protein
MKLTVLAQSIRMALQNPNWSFEGEQMARRNAIRHAMQAHEHHVLEDAPALVLRVLHGEALGALLRGICHMAEFRDPETGKRVARMNPKSEWLIEEIPELRIVDDNLWARTQARLDEMALVRHLRKHALRA